MADKTINVRHVQKHDTESNWSTNNPVLLEYELGFVKGSTKYKIGDGNTKWNDLTTYEGISSDDKTKLDNMTLMTVDEFEALFK